MKRHWMVLMLGLALLPARLSAADTATATLAGTSDDSPITGTIILVDTPEGLQVSAKVADVPPGTHGFHIHGFGSCTEDGKAANRSFLIDSDGEVKAHYDKIHMFDVDLGDGEVHRESNAYEAGSRAVTADLPWGTLGMTVCYDLRFPRLYRALAKQGGADFLTVPSAFTRPTGKAHWHVLLRARAIENGCYVFAPAQCGEHENGRKTFGHSLIINPWGEILADGGEEPGFVSAEADPAEVTAARAKIPAFTHDRDFS